MPVITFIYIHVNRVSVKQAVNVNVTKITITCMPIKYKTLKWPVSNNADSDTCITVRGLILVGYQFFFFFFFWGGGVVEGPIHKFQYP